MTASGPLPAPALEARGLQVEALTPHGPQTLVHELGFGLPRRAVLGVVGASGAGKSVLAKALCNALEPPLHARGRVLLGGQALLGLAPRQMRGLWGRRIAYIGADPARAFDPTWAVGEQIVEKLRCVEPGLARRDAVERVLALLAEARIPDPKARFADLPQRFSSGMIQRAVIVDALITDPEVLIADAVTQALDATVAAQIIALLQALRARFDTAIVFTSTSLAVVKDIASEPGDSVLVLAGGRVVEQASLGRLVTAPGQPETRRMLAELVPVWDESPGPRAVPPEPAGPPLLVVRDLRKSFHRPRRDGGFGSESVQAVRGIGFELRRGESLGIVGESGCGKSTLARLLAGLEAADSGTLVFDGEAGTGGSRAGRLRRHRRLQLVLPDPYRSIPAFWSIGRTIAEPLRIQSASASRAAEREQVLTAMDDVGLPRQWVERLPAGLSAGQRQRVALARALVLAPALLILDETLTALDPGEQGALLDLLARLQRARGLAYVFISHDLAMVRRACNRVAVMYLGRVVEIGRNRALFFAPRHPYTRALLAAMPVLEPNPFARGGHLVGGETPSPIELPRGCSFASRCPRALAACLDGEPVLRRIDAADASGERYVACRRADEALPSQA
jgi:peptide/nickel transport system ATP-binding protein